MPKPKKKLWKKPKVIIIDIGRCRYCGEEMTNQDSFVAFYPESQGKAHYQCMKEDDDLKKKVLNSVEQQIKEEKKGDHF